MILKVTQMIEAIKYGKLRMEYEKLGFEFFGVLESSFFVVQGML